MVVYLIFLYFKTIMFFVLVNDYLKRTYPETYFNCFITCSYNLIYTYSKLQICYNKIKYKLKEYIFSNQQIKTFIDNIYKSENLQEIEYINNGKVITKYNKNDTIINVVKEGTPFYIFSDLNNYNLNKNIKINKKIIQNTEITTDYEVSNVYFLLVEIILGDNKYKINLKNETYNYYLVDNILDKKFFTYYLMNYEKINLSYDYIYNNDKFIVKIIDNNVNIKEVDMTNNLNYITLKKNDYKY